MNSRRADILEVVLTLHYRSESRLKPRNLRCLYIRKTYPHKYGRATWELWLAHEIVIDRPLPWQKRAVTALPQMADLEALRDRILLDLKLGKQSLGYKATQKALNRFIAELTNLA